MVDKIDRSKDWVYDLECYPNFFSCALENVENGSVPFFEISEWKNDGVALYEFIMSLSYYKHRLIGYNNIHYDYPLLHLVLQYKGLINHDTIKAKSDMIFNSGFANQNAHTVWEKDRLITQIDLLKVHHFDNDAKRTSLKMLEFNMRSPNIKDLPFDPKLPLTREQADELIIYNKHDVSETKKFLLHSYSAIDFREELSLRYNKDFLNHNDTKIGKDYFIMELNKSGIETKNKKTKHDFINIGELLLPYINFESCEFNALVNFFKTKALTEKNEQGNIVLKGAVTESVTHKGFRFDLGLGGVHGSLKNSIIRTSDTHTLIDVDVSSYYPNLAIANKFFPTHLSDKFCEIYLDVYNQRKGYGKKTPENAMLKLALNGVYGDSNSAYKSGGYSPFYDPTYTLKVTINGQLLLCMLAEKMMGIPNLTMVQINTDGITFLCPNEYLEHSRELCKWWEILTGLELEEAIYKSMFIRDVNNYIAEYADGKLKRIGCYAYERAAENSSTREVQWHKNNSMLVVAKAAEAALVRNENIEQFIRNHKDIYDFMLVTKVPRTSKLILRQDVLWGDSFLGSNDEDLQNITRYYPSKKGGYLIKVMPHTKPQIKAEKQGDHYKHKNTGVYKVVKKGGKPPSGMYELLTNDEKRTGLPPREISIQSGVKVKDCSNMNDFNIEDLDYEFYIEEAKKITTNLLCS